ncbi:hypothetical protein ACE6H2_018005 [Prunus campanulata]
MPIASQIALSNFRKATNDLLVAKENLNEAMNTVVSYHKFVIKSVEDLYTLLQLAKRANWDTSYVTRTICFDTKNKDIKGALEPSHMNDKVQNMKLKMVAMKPVDAVSGYCSWLPL